MCGVEICLVLILWLVLANATVFGLSKQVFFLSFHYVVMMMFCKVFQLCDHLHGNKIENGVWKQNLTTLITTSWKCLEVEESLYLSTIMNRYMWVSDSSYLSWYPLSRPYALFITIKALAWLQVWNSNGHF